MHCYHCLKEITDQEQPVAGLHRACYLSCFNLDEVEDFSDVIAHAIDDDGEQAFKGIISSFYQGKFKKYSAQLGKKYYILKVKDMGFPELPATEFLCNQIANALKIQVPAFYLLSIQNYAETFVCENFMQKHTDANLVHIYHFLKSTEEYNCETLLQIIQEKTQQLREVERFIEICLFDALIGNHDRHGRNLGLIQSPGRYVLSPWYDNPSYLAIADEFFLTAQHEPRGKIATLATLEPKMIDYVKEWIRLGYKNQVINFYERISLNEIYQLISSSFISDKRKTALMELIQRRYQELQDGLASLSK